MLAKFIFSAVVAMSIATGVAAQSDYSDPAAASARIQELKRSIAPQLNEIQKLHSALLGRSDSELVGIGFTISDSGTASGDVTVFGGDSETIHIGCHSETLMKSCPGPCPCAD